MTRTTRPFPCSYIKGQVEQRLIVDLSTRPEAHEILAKAGFRRMDHWAYRPICAHCQACQAIRIPAGDGTGGALQLTRGHKRILRKNTQLTREILPNHPREDHFALFQTYQASRHGNGEMARMDYEHFALMIGSSPLDTILVEYRDGDNLFGVVLIDLQQDGLSMVYSFFDPAESARSPGRFLILDTAAIAYMLGFKYVYLGYYIRDSHKMNYKAQFAPAEIMHRGKWIPFE